MGNNSCHGNAMENIIMIPESPDLSWIRNFTSLQRRPQELRFRMYYDTSGNETYCRQLYAWPRFGVSLSNMYLERQPHEVQKLREHDGWHGEGKYG